MKGDNTTSNNWYIVQFFGDSILQAQTWRATTGKVNDTAAQYSFSRQFI